MKKIVLFGGYGMLGTEMHNFFTDEWYEVIRPRHQEVDIVNYADVYKYLADQKPDIVINTAGQTGKPNIDRCEAHKEETALTNISGSLNVACAAKLLGIYSIYLSSGCIYQGDNGGRWFSELDPSNYDWSFYSWTKAKAEELLKPFDVLQLRIRMVILSKPHPRNFIDKMARYTHIINEENSVTIVDDMLQAMKILIDQKVTGIMNMVNPWVLRWHDMLALYKEIVDPKHTFTPISMEELTQNFVCSWRSNCLLNGDRLAQYIQLKPIDQRIKEIMYLYKNNMSA